MNVATLQIETPETTVPHCRAVNLKLLPLAPGTRTKPNTPENMARDVRTVAHFVHIYCSAKHPAQAKTQFLGLNADHAPRKSIHLCPDCTKLLQHATVKRTHCAREQKPECKHCPTQCYAPKYRAQIREVMKFSGKRLLLRGRLDYLWHLFF